MGATLTLGLNVKDFYVKACAVLHVCELRILAADALDGNAP